SIVLNLEIWIVVIYTAIGEYNRCGHEFPFIIWTHPEGGVHPVALDYPLDPPQLSVSDPEIGLHVASRLDNRLEWCHASEGHHTDPDCQPVPDTSELLRPPLSGNAGNAIRNFEGDEGTKTQRTDLKSNNRVINAELGLL